MSRRKIKPKKGTETEVGGFVFVCLFVILGWSGKPLRGDIWAGTVEYDGESQGNIRGTAFQAEGAASTKALTWKCVHCV